MLEPFKLVKLLDQQELTHYFQFFFSCHLQLLLYFSLLQGEGVVLLFEIHSILSRSLQLGFLLSFLFCFEQVLVEETQVQGRRLLGFVLHFRFPLFLLLEGGEALLHLFVLVSMACRFSLYCLRR
jgi:hypothetical protein